MQKMSKKKGEKKCKWLYLYPRYARDDAYTRQRQRKIRKQKGIGLHFTTKKKNVL